MAQEKARRKDEAVAELKRCAGTQFGPELVEYFLNGLEIELIFKQKRLMGGAILLTDAFAYNRIVTDAQGKPVDFELLEVNEAFEELTGLNRASITFRKAAEILAQTGVFDYNWMEPLVRVALTGKSICLEHFFEPAQRWFEISVYSQEPGHFGMVFHDITKKKKGEKQLREANLKCFQLINALQEGVWAIDQDYYTTYVNTPMAEMLGYTVEEMIGKHLYEFMDDEWIERAKENLEQGKTGKHERIEFQFVRKDGRRVYTLLLTAPTFDKDGQYLGAVAGVLDFTNRKEAEDALRESERNYREIFNSTIDALFIHDRNTGEIIDVNQSAVRMYGCEDKNELINCHVDTFNNVAAGYTSEKLLEMIHNALDSNKGFFQWHAKKKNGELFWVEVSLKLAQIGGKERILAAVRDITGRNQAETELAEKNAALSLLNSIVIEQASVKDYQSLIELILEQLSKYTSAAAVIFNEYDAEKKVLITRNIKTDQSILNKALQLWGKNFLNTITPVNDALYQETISSIIGFGSTLQEVTKGCVPTAVSSLVKKVTGASCFVGLAFVVEGRLYGSSMLALRAGQKVPSTEFLKSFAYVSAISLRRKQTEEKVLYISFHDNLTGLYNRAYLEQQMERLDTKRQLPISIIMSDLNGLKLVNDTYGQNVGDQLLMQAAEILKKFCRKEDIIARWSGDEFVVLLPQTTIKEVRAICERIIDRCRIVDVEDVPLSMALGTAVKKSMEKTLSDVLKEAENNMYKHKLVESRSTKRAVLNALLNTLEEKSYETEEHSQRMQEIAMKIGKKLNLPETELDRLTLLVYLHDIGKITVPEEILTKKERLTEKDWEQIKKHPESGFRIARSMEEFAHVAEDILCHHEHWNGKGYPKGIKGKEIPLLARILTIVDAYEVMINGRPYKVPMSKQEAAAELKRCAGEQFDPELVEVFMSIIS